MGDSPHVAPSRLKKARRKTITVKDIYDLYLGQDGYIFRAYMERPLEWLDVPYPERHRGWVRTWDTMNSWTMSRAIELTEALKKNPALPLLMVENPDFGKRFTAYADSLKQASKKWYEAYTKDINLSNHDRALLAVLVRRARRSLPAAAQVVTSLASLEERLREDLSAVALGVAIADLNPLVSPDDAF